VSIYTTLGGRSLSFCNIGAHMGGMIESS